MATRAADTVLVTGASRGIGRAVALHLAGAGLRVFAGVRRREDGEELAAAGVGIEPVALDVTADASIEEARRHVSEASGGSGLLGLVNNAGIATPGPLEHVTRGELEAQFGVNLFGAVLVTRALLPLLRQARGRIVNVGAANATLAMPLMGALSASKAALEAVSDALRVELRGSGVRVALVEPGMTYAESEKEPFAAHVRSEIDAAIERLPEASRPRYGPALKRLEALNLRALARAAPPEEVARRVHHALTAPRPRTRYWCGPDAKLAALLGRFASAGMRDAMWRRTLGL